jgi:two-component system nitrogen regulation sensor histidine kinase GlnL
MMGIPMMSENVMSPSTQSETAGQIAAALPMPVLIVGQGQTILFANPASEQFFDMGAGVLLRQKLSDIVPFGSPLIQIIAQAKNRNASVGERDINLSTPRHGERIADVNVTPLPGDSDKVLITLQERGFAQRLDRQLLHRGAVRSLHGMAAVLAHEIKNPLAGIRGAAQLLEESLADSDRELTQLICLESDRISALIDRMEQFGDTRALPRAPVNIHDVLDRVRKVAETGFGHHVTFLESFDPSLPAVLGDRDQLIQVFMNLVRNACDAVAPAGGEVMLTTRFRPGMHMSAAVAGSRLGLPLEVVVRDNGHGIAADLLPHIFDPFVTTKSRGSGLGLALVAKIVGDHGGVIECEAAPGKTLFRVLLPQVDNSRGA